MTIATGFPLEFTPAKAGVGMTKGAGMTNIGNRQ